MSRIGRMPITVPAGVTVTIGEKNEVTVQGPKGTLSKISSSVITSTFIDLPSNCANISITCVIIVSININFQKFGIRLKLYFYLRYNLSYHNKHKMVIECKLSPHQKENF